LNNNSENKLSQKEFKFKNVSKKDRVVELDANCKKNMKLFINESQTSVKSEVMIEFLDPVKDKDVMLE